MFINFLLAFKSAILQTLYWPSMLYDEGVLLFYRDLVLQAELHR